jgi:methylase of polypeptide subunit release factors
MSELAVDRISKTPEGMLRLDSRERYIDLIKFVTLSSPDAQGIVEALAHTLAEYESDVAPWFALWKDHCLQYFDLDAAEEILTDTVRCPAGTRLFLAHSYCKVVLDEIVALALQDQALAKRPSLFDWVNVVESLRLDRHRSELRKAIDRIGNLSALTAVESSDLLAAIYQEILPPRLRHLLGEYYTPSWLVEYCISQIKPLETGQQSMTILDPAAGSGSFLAHCVSHLSVRSANASVKVVGFDVNPLAVDFCWTNIAIAKSKCANSQRHFDVRIHLADAVVDPVADNHGALFGGANLGTSVLGARFSPGAFDAATLQSVIDQFDLAPSVQASFERTLKQYLADVSAATESINANTIVGNPPWITWDALPNKYRTRAAAQWASSALVVNTGWRARVAAGKTDFSSLFVYRAAERHAVSNAAMVFVLPLSLFQSHLSGAGFRDFKTSDGRRYALVALDDFSSVKVFPDASNRTSVGTFVVDKKAQFPIRYTTWTQVRSSDGDVNLLSSSLLGGPLLKEELNSPIIAFEKGDAQLKTVVGNSDYRARGGVNTGGANTILWLELLSEDSEVYHIRNVAKSRRASSPVEVGEAEKDVVYSLLCGSDMRRWKACPSKSILLFYSPNQPKRALPQSVVEAQFPRAYEYVSRFRQSLAGRKEYHRWGCSGPFYEVYRIGPYTFSPIKVVWQHTGYRKALNVSVVDDRNRKPIVPDQKAIVIPFDDLEEAHYACAFLSSTAIAELLDRYLGTDASTHILDYVALRKYRPDDERHRRLAELSVLAHKTVAESRNVKEFEDEIDSVVRQLVSA